MKSYGRVPTTVETWPGAMNPSRRRPGESRIACSGGPIVTWLQNAEKFSIPSARALQQRQRRRGRGGLEADRKEDHLTLGVPARKLECVERRVDHANIRATRLGLEQRAASAGHPHHVAERREDHLGPLRQCDRVVDAPHRNHADRAPRPVHEVDLGRGQVLEPVLVDRVRVTAADLHQLHLATRLDKTCDLLRELLRQLPGAKLVDVLHASFTSAIPA